MTKLQPYPKDLSEWLKDLTFKEIAWLGQNPLKIDGYDVHFSDLASSVAYGMKKAFPINEVPEDILQELEALKTLLEIAEAHLKRFVRLTARRLEETDP